MKNISFGWRGVTTFMEAKLMNAVSTIRMDKTAFSVVSLTDAPDEKDYWQSKTPQERLQTVELLRQLNYGYDSTTARLQRVLAIDELQRR